MQSDCSALNHGPSDPKRRNFFALTAAAMGAVGLGGAGWALIDSLNPAADVYPFEWFDIGDMALGERRIMNPRRYGPVIVHRRTTDEVARARTIGSKTKYPEADVWRVLDPGWFVAYGYCTYRGCLILEQVSFRVMGSLDGWFCPCCGSAYDLSGRAGRGPAPRNLDIPAYTFDAPGRIQLDGRHRTMQRS